jgi:hypothetical protein
MTFLLSEDKALHTRLQGMVVNDQRATADGIPRQVGVFYGQPDQEVRNQAYPYVTIDMIGIQRATEREVRLGFTNPAYLQPPTLATNQQFTASELIPVDIDYQITTFARQPRHDREIVSQLLSSKLPIRFGSLDVEDNTVRRLDVLNVSKRDGVEQGKRLFMNAITVRISSEITNGQLETVYKVLEVHIDNPTAARAGGRNSQPHFSGLGPTIITP